MQTDKILPVPAPNYPARSADAAASASLAKAYRHIAGQVQFVSSRVGCDSPQWGRKRRILRQLLQQNLGPLGEFGVARAGYFNQ